MEWKIGEIKQVNGEWYQCIPAGIFGCPNCDLQDIGNCRSEFPCEALQRKDREEVIFKKLEKVGGIYVHNSIIVQKYRIKTAPVIMPNEPYMYFNAINNTIAIEIEQNKEDMGKKNQDIIEVNGKKYKFIPLETRDACSEFCAFRNLDCEEYLDIPCNSKERKDGHNGYFIEVPPEEIAGKIVNEVMKNVKHQIEKNMETNKLKPFSLEAAKAGKPVCTRDGRKARIICFDAKGDFPIVALVETNNIEEVYQYTNNGLFFHLESNDLERVDDLMMLPEKKEGWVNVYKDSIYNTKDEALIGRSDIRDYIDTIKVSWEE